MNAFARYLFQGLFSWVREAIRQLSDPSLIDGWLTRNWLSALIPLLLICTVIDYLVWLFRWRPDLAWRSDLRRSVMNLQREERQMRRFRRGYDKENADIGAVAQPLMDAPVPEDMADIRPADAVDEEALAADAMYDWQYAEMNKPAEAPPERHRRSERYQRGGRRKPPARKLSLEADDEPVNGLPPVLSKEEAFRAPVYPRQADQDRRS